MNEVDEKLLTTTLDPCPFCGGEGVPDKTLRDGYENDQADQDAFAYFVRCVSCAAQGPWRKNQHGAKREWNSRWPKG